MVINESIRLLIILIMLFALSLLQVSSKTPLKTAFKSQNLFILLFTSFLMLQGCANQPISLKPDIKPDYLELCLNFATQMSTEDKLLHIDAVNSFISSYNAKNLHYEIRPCVQVKASNAGVNGNLKENSVLVEKRVSLIIQKTRYVPPSEQILYVVISGVGIYSVLNGGFGLVWAGFSGTTFGVNLSDDLTDKKKTIYRQFTSSPFFHELTTVKHKHMKQFQVSLFELFNELAQSEHGKENKQELTVEN